MTSNIWFRVASTETRALARSLIIVSMLHELAICRRGIGFYRVRIFDDNLFDRLALDDLPRDWLL